MVRRFLPLVLAIGAATGAVAGPAQTIRSEAAPSPASGPSPAPDSLTVGPANTVIVTGRRVPPKKVVQHLTSAITQTVDASEALARFPDAICPISEGMPLDFDARLSARIRDDAAAAGIPVGKPGCQPNVQVLVVPNGQAVVRELRRTRAYVFGDLEPQRIARIADDPGPVHGWTVTRRRSRDEDTERVGTMREDVPEIQVRDASIILASTRMDMTASVLLIDVGAVIGKTVNQIADYAAMRTLAPTRPTGTGKNAARAAASADDTILGLFAPGDPAGRPRGLTAFDAGYLKALYHGQATELAPGKVRRIAQSITAARPARADPAASDAAQPGPAPDR